MCARILGSADPTNGHLSAQLFRVLKTLSRAVVLKTDELGRAERHRRALHPSTTPPSPHASTGDGISTVSCFSDNVALETSLDTMYSFAGLALLAAAAIPSVLGHGVVTTPTPRQYASVAQSACGSAVYNVLTSGSFCCLLIV